MPETTPVPIAPAIPTEMPAAITSGVPAKKSSKKLYMIIGGLLLVIFLLLIGGAIVLLQNNKPSPAATNPTPNPVPQAAAHGWVATYSITTGNTSTPIISWYMVTDTDIATPTPITFTGLAKYVRVNQVLTYDTLIVTACDNYYGGSTQCDIYRYTISTATAEKLASYAGSLSDAHIMNNGNLVYREGDFSGMKIQMVKSGTTTTLLSLGDTLGRGVSLGDTNSLYYSPDNKTFAYVSTFGGAIATLDYGINVYSETGGILTQLCATTGATVYCAEPLLDNANIYFNRSAGDATILIKYPFTVADSGISLTNTFSYNPVLSPDMASVASWNYSGETAAPGISFNIYKLADGSITTVNKPYSNLQWLDDSKLMAIKQEATPEPGIYNFQYAGLEIINTAGNTVAVLEGGSALDATPGPVLNF